MAPFPCIDTNTSPPLGGGAQKKTNESKLQRRARRHATIKVVDFSDVTRYQNMVDVSDVTTCQNIRKVSEHMYPDKNVMWQSDRHFSLVGSFWSWSHKTSTLR